jgi:hypothetical protein
LYFLKSLKINRRIWTDTALFDGLPYDVGTQTDHLFRGTLSTMLERMVDQSGELLSYSEFIVALRNSDHPFVPLFFFLDGMSRGEESRLRHDRIVCAHLVIPAILASFGYDYQQPSKAEFEKILSQIEHEQVLGNLLLLVQGLKLESDRGFSKLVSLLNAKSTNLDLS